MKSRAGIHLAGTMFLLAVSAAAWFFLLQPAIGARGNYEMLVSQLEEARDHRTDLQARSRSYQAQIAEAEHSVSQHPLSLNPPEQLNARLQAITDLAFKTGFQLDSLEAGRQDDFDQYGAVEIRLAGKCLFPVLQAFLQALESTMPDVAVSAADVSGRYADGASMPAISLKLRWHTASKSVTTTD